MGEFLWVEKYRPQTISECILPDGLKKTFQEYVDAGEISNMLLCGTAGTGKTTVARALCNELGCDYIVINGSDESGIDVLRTKIRDFASTVSFESKAKVVILDEADYLNPNSTQPALRAFIEEFSGNCRFIFTCNFKNRIIEPLHSRTSVIDFKIDKKDRPEMAQKFMGRMQYILTQEGIPYEQNVLAELLMKHFPDYRRVINELQRYSKSGSIDSGILSNIAEINTKELIDSLKDKDWKKMRQWVVNNVDNDPQGVYRKVYDSLIDKVKQVPHLVLLIADYQYKSAFVADQEINLTACLTDIMASVEFK
ncbi:MAG: DNA polymerase [Actinobacteria bacterium]|nr:DNA polymerase [Actinomycetota bacterium]|tara:strand:- start:21190 stop:22119 length:930 start_codon:yes stop_codon:yes gene_type:complete